MTFVKKLLLPRQNVYIRNELINKLMFCKLNLEQHLNFNKNNSRQAVYQSLNFDEQIKFFHSLYTGRNKLLFALCLGAGFFCLG